MGTTETLVEQLVQRSDQLEQASTLSYWFEQTPEHLSFDERMTLAKAAHITFKLMIRVGVR
jgi:hypothetical protein